MTTEVQTISYNPGRAALQDVIPGQSLAWRVRFFEEDGTTPIDITADDFECEIRTSSGTLFIALAVGDGITISDDHEITIELTAAETDNFDHELTYEYQTNWITGGKTYPCNYGTIDLLKPVI